MNASGAIIARTTRARVRLRRRATRGPSAAAIAVSPGSGRMKSWRWVFRPWLRRARGLKQRPDLAQVVIEDRLAALPAQRLDQLVDTNTGQVRVLVQQPRDLGLERIELRSRRRP
jgi:hypothetical protein